MRMKTENKEEDPNIQRPLNENGIQIQTKPGLTNKVNGRCGVPNGETGPTESENNLKEDLSNIHTKGNKEKCARAQRASPAHQPGPSQQKEQEQGPSRGIYYGIKSYLHHFYGPPDKEVLKSGEYVQGDDFRFLAEPQRKGCWVRAGLWIGINLVLLGGIAMLVGYLTPPHQAVVGQFEEFTVLDRWAVNFNYHLMMCQFVGLITFSFGAVVVVCSLLVSNYQSSTTPPAYLVMGAYLPTPTPGKHTDNPPTWGIHCIPLSGMVKSVQPQFIRSQY